MVFVSSRAADPDRNYGNNLWRVPATPADGPAEPEPLTNDDDVKGQPAYSPDGRYIAYLSADDGVYGINRLTVIPAAGGEPEFPAAALDRWVRDFRFSADSRWIYLNYDQEGGTHLARVRLRDGRLERLVEGDRVVSGMDLADDGTLVVRLNGANDAADIYRVRGGRVERLTSMNDEFFATRQLGAREKVRYTLDDGTMVEAFVTLPPDFEPGRRYPTILNIHGGPVGQFSWGYSSRTQMFATSGYVVVEPNPRGSTGRRPGFRACHLPHLGHHGIPRRRRRGGSRH
ncbi:MAG: hypothetical protein U5K76_09440 [Woeseiaceae bacterium]|nr:hypothetical protein [Woeseiaceae bacterium]